MAIKIKDIDVLQRYGFKSDINTADLKKYWVYECSDNKTYVFVYEDDLIIRFTPYGFVRQYINQLDIIFKLINDGHCELKENDK